MRTSHGTKEMLGFPLSVLARERVVSGKRRGGAWNDNGSLLDVMRQASQSHLSLRSRVHLEPPKRTRP